MPVLPDAARVPQANRMTRTWLQKILQQNDTDLLSYDFGRSCPAWQAWWFRGCVAAGCLGLVWFLITILT